MQLFSLIDSLGWNYLNMYSYYQFPSYVSTNDDMNPRTWYEHVMDSIRVGIWLGTF